MLIDPVYHPRFKGTVASVIDHGTWDLPLDVLVKPEVAARVASIILHVSLLPDKLVWIHSPDGSRPAKPAFAFLHPLAAPLHWAYLVWKSCISPSHSFIFWRLMHQKMPTDENL